MARFILRRMTIIPLVVLIVNFVGFAYATYVPPLRAARTPYFYREVKAGPLLPAYREYLEGAVHLDFGPMPTGQAGRTVGAVIGKATVASLGLLGLALVLSAILGVALGLAAAQVLPPRVANWLTAFSTVGLAMPSFYIGSLAVMAVFYYVLWRPDRGMPLPLEGFGWDSHLVLPLLVLIVQPTVYIARLTAGLLVDELGKRYVVTARSVGFDWHTIRWRHALRNIAGAVILVVTGSMRLLMGELIVVEWLFRWPGLGLLLAQSLIYSQTNVGLLDPGFLYPPIVATVLAVVAFVFLAIDLVASILVRAVDPRLAASEEGVGSASVAGGNQGARRRNWPLWIGTAIVLLVVAVAIVGPVLAPKDPLEENNILQVGDDWVTPSFPAFTVPGFPLGSDQFGRDLMSRLMWAVRPTLIMVAIVAAIRLVIGTAFGLASGWSSGRISRVLDLITAGALALPVLLVALGVIAAIGVETGLVAFVVGLCLTGWAESASIVREQTELIKGQQYVEAARALGWSDRSIVSGHVLPQVMPVVWMLFAFEISSTLMVTASLGFLGYYIGGDLWVEIGDFVAQRISGMPELGQMLATADLGITRLGLWGLPWALLVTGTAVFVVVLGFDLLGQGLRQRLGLEAKPSSRLSRLTGRVGGWLEAILHSPDGRRPALLYLALAGVLLASIAGGWFWWRSQSLSSTGAPMDGVAVPGDHLWAAQDHDAHGTLQARAAGPGDPEVVWTFRDPDGLSGGPAVAADGTVYIGSRGGRLAALDPDGTTRWEATLAAAAVGVPALDATGYIYVADKGGGLSSLTPAGVLRWRATPEGENLALAGPIAAPTGTLYYPVGKGVVAVSPDGGLQWLAPTPQTFRVAPPQSDSTGDMLFWKDVALTARDGGRLELQVPFDTYEFLVGADGFDYIRSANIVSRWELGDSGLEIIETANWDYRAFLGIQLTPQQAGVTQDRVIWLFYAPMRQSLVAWLDPTGRVMGTLDVSLASGRMVAVGENATAYFCGQGEYESQQGPVCFAYRPGFENPDWGLVLPRGGRPLGGALVPGRLYVALEGPKADFLYALDEP